MKITTQSFPLESDLKQTAEENINDEEETRKPQRSIKNNERKKSAIRRKSRNRLRPASSSLEKRSTKSLLIGNNSMRLKETISKALIETSTSRVSRD